MPPAMPAILPEKGGSSGKTGATTLRNASPDSISVMHLRYCISSDPYERKDTTSEVIVEATLPIKNATQSAHKNFPTHLYPRTSWLGFGTPPACCRAK